MTALPGWARELLRCPACHAELADEPADGPADGPAPVLACTGCGRRYPVREGVPVLLVDEADDGTAEEA